MDINQNLNNLMQEAQKMQQRMQEAQQKLTELKVTGEAGGGLVSVEMNGRHEVPAGGVKIKPAAFKEDVEFLADLLIAAFNSASRRIEEASKNEISKLTAGLNIPTDFMKKEDNKE
jgi:hypothetical protein